MKVFIAGTCAISPEHNVEEKTNSSISVVKDPEYLSAIVPDYKDLIDPKLSRRMARIIKMSVVAGKKSLQQAAVKDPGAIVVGTGLGCLQDTEKFLADLIENNENLLSPTAFIQSTHNTIAGQIALILNCYNHNFTYVQRGNSFESALQDACMQIEEGNNNILVGGVDEITSSLFEILHQTNCVSKVSERQEGFTSADEKPLLGEGACFFLLTSSATPSSVACIEGMDFFYNPSSFEAIEIRILQFLEKLDVDLEKISAVMMGYNGYKKDDLIYSQVGEHLFPTTTMLTFKNLCGEYFTSSAFGLHLTSEILRKQIITDNTFLSGTRNPKLEYILFYNHYKGKYHTLILLSRCQLS